MGKGSVYNQITKTTKPKCQKKKRHSSKQKPKRHVNYKTKIEKPNRPQSTSGLIVFQDNGALAPGFIKHSQHTRHAQHSQHSQPPQQHAPHTPPQPHQPHPSHPQAPTCLCPHCGASFNAVTLLGKLTAHVCPLCEQQINPKHYDLQAMEARQELNALEAELAAEERVVKRYKFWQKVCKFPLLRPFKAKADRNLAREQQAEQEIKARMAPLKRHMESLASMHYYTSAWFARTGFMLKQKTAPAYTLKPYYNKDGKWGIHSSENKSRGIAAEMAVFNALLSEAQNPESPLFGAKVLPNLYINREVYNGSRNGSFWNQIDLLLLTKTAAFVLEVKSRNMHIVSNAPFKTIYAVRKGAGKTPNDPNYNPKEDYKAWGNEETKALSQNSFHTQTFNSLRTPYDFQDIYELTVFVNAKSFASDTSSFVDHVCVSCLDGENQFVAPILEVVSSGRELVDQAELDALAEELLKKYGDIHQFRQGLHADRIARAERW